MINPEKTLAELRTIRLSDSRRLRMREELASYADLHAYTQVVHVRGNSRYLSYFPAGFWRVSAALLFVLSTLGGTAYAASGTLPGETLYPVKIHLTESVQTVLIPSTSGKAAWHSILAERRLEEATDLAMRNELNPEIQETLADNFTTHVHESIEAADQLQQEGSITAALSVRSDLEARITAHEDILGRVVDHLARNGVESDPSEFATQDLLTVVQERQDAAEGARLSLEDSFETSEVEDALLTVKVAVTSDADSIAAAETEVAAGSPTEMAREARTLEIASILLRNGTLLTSLELASTTQATTTGVATTSTESVEENEDDQSLPAFWRSSEENIKR